MEKKKITCYSDLDVYQRAYRACLIVMREIVPKLPANEKYDLGNQLSRSCKAVPRLIAEGFAKKHQRAGYQKYLDDSMAESNETQVGLCQCRDLYYKEIEVTICVELIQEYQIIGKQLYKLSEAWSKFSKVAKQ
ncbi:MAG TPA: four helix bundle protein [Saprospiraceae bacterium]|nr:four helix bundle protein [Saprospiraceae bacterium]